MAPIGSGGLSSRRTFIRLAAVGYPALCLAQTEYWNTKDPTAYSEDEKYTMQHSSPWARTARAEVPGAVPSGLQLVVAPAVAGGGRIGKPTPPPPADATPPPEVANARETLAFYGQLTVRWESAKPILQITQTVLPAEFLNHYVISVTGLPAGVLSIDWTNLAAATLTAPRHSPERAEFVSLTGDKLALLFAFRQLHPPIKENDGMLSFTMNLSGIKIKTAFDPKRMVYRGQLAL